MTPPISSHLGTINDAPYYSDKDLHAILNNQNMNALKNLSGVELQSEIAALETLEHNMHHFFMSLSPQQRIAHPRYNLLLELCGWLLGVAKGESVSRYWAKFPQGHGQKDAMVAAQCKEAFLRAQSRLLSIQVEDWTRLYEEVEQNRKAAKEALDRHQYFSDKQHLHQFYPSIYGLEREMSKLHPTWKLSEITATLHDYSVNAVFLAALTVQAVNSLATTRKVVIKVAPMKRLHTAQLAFQNLGAEAYNQKVIHNKLKSYPCQPNLLPVEAPEVIFDVESFAHEVFVMPLISPALTLDLYVRRLAPKNISQDDFAIWASLHALDTKQQMAPRIQIALSITVAVQRLYKDGLEFSDLHEENILIGDGTICLIDFADMNATTAESEPKTLADLKRKVMCVERTIQKSTLTFMSSKLGLGVDLTSANSYEKLRDLLSVAYLKYR